MQNFINYPKFFLGANSPKGFISKFDQLYDPEDSWFCYILKGGPGTGKSTLMKKVAKAAEKLGIDFELIYCSSDPNSLDAVIFPTIKVCIADGTAPHTLDPIYPGVSSKIINLGSAWDNTKLIDSGDDIINLTNQNSSFHNRSKRYLEACGSIENDTFKIVSASMDSPKIKAYTQRLSKKLFKKPLDKVGTEKIRFISAITPDGIVFFEDTVLNLSSNIFVIDDEYGPVGNEILSNIKTDALDYGFDIISCYCPMNPLNKLEAIFIPKLDIAFVTSNTWHPLPLLKDYKKIHTKRFLDNDKISSRKQRLSFNRRIQRELINEAIINLNRAKATHDLLEQPYIKAMDYKKLNHITNSIISEIFKNK